jgi:hypothetical protein
MVAARCVVGSSRGRPEVAVRDATADAATARAAGEGAARQTGTCRSARSCTTHAQRHPSCPGAAVRTSIGCGPHRPPRSWGTGLGGGSGAAGGSGRLIVDPADPGGWSSSIQPLCAGRDPGEGLREDGGGVCVGLDVDARDAIQNGNRKASEDWAPSRLPRNVPEALDRVMRPSNSLGFRTPMLAREVGYATFSATRQGRRP